MTKLMLNYGRMRPTPEHLERLARLGDDVELVLPDSREDVVAAAVDADAFLGHSNLRIALPVARNLRWIQSLVAGVDSMASPALFDRAPIVTRCPIFSDIIALHAVTMAYSIVRRIPEMARMQTQGISRRPPGLLPVPRTAMILGLGEIGMQIAGILRPLGVIVRGVATAHSDEKASAVDALLVGEAWRAYLPETDLLFVTLPSTKETANMVDASVLGALPEHAVLVNVGRGQTVDTTALIAALDAGQLGGAALDVVEPAPRSADDPLWRTPRLLLTPHMASFIPERQARTERFVEDQVRRFLNDEPLLYQVDLDRLQAESTRT